MTIPAETYKDLIESWAYLKKGKKGTLFCLALPAKKGPPWFFMGKPSLVNKKPKIMKLYAADEYVKKPIIKGRIEHHGRQLILVAEEDKLVSKLKKAVAKAGPQLMKAAKAPEAKDSAGAMKKLAALMGKAAAMTADQYAELAALGDTSKPVESASTDTTDLDATELKELEAFLNDLPEVTEDEYQAVFGQDSADVQQCIDRAKTLQASLKQLDTGKSVDAPVVGKALIDLIGDDELTGSQLANALIGVFAAGKTQDSSSLSPGMKPSEVKLAVQLAGDLEAFRERLLRIEGWQTKIDGATQEIIKASEAYQQVLDQDEVPENALVDYQKTLDAIEEKTTTWAEKLKASHMANETWVTAVPEILKSLTQ